MTLPSTANGGFPNVVVTALAATTSIAPDIEGTWKGLIAGESGIEVLEDEFVEKFGLPVWIGGHLKEPIDNHMTRLELRRMAYVQRMALHVGRQVWQNAGSPDDIDKDRLGVVIGTGLGGGERIVETYDTMNEHGIRKVSPLAVQMCMPNGAAAVVGLEIGARAGVITPVSACSSGSEAIAHAWRQIVMGDADMIVCGGVEGMIEALPIAAFSMMRAMSTRNDEPEKASRPFDKDRDGFVFGEAGALMVIETEEHAKARGAQIIGRVMGAGITSDAYHMVAPGPDGIRAGAAMTRAIQTAGLSPRTLTTSTLTARPPRSAMSPRPTPFTSPACSTPRSTRQSRRSATRSAPSARWSPCLLCWLCVTVLSPRRSILTTLIPKSTWMSLRASLVTGILSMRSTTRLDSAGTTSRLPLASIKNQRG